jgi:hypothetical protein
MSSAPKTISRSKIIHFTLTISGVGLSLDDAFVDAVSRLGDDPTSAVYGEVEWTGDGRHGDFQVVPIQEDEHGLPAFVYDMFGDYEA